MLQKISMKKIILTLLNLTTACFLHGQDKKEVSAIVAEGRQLYRSEMASWFGTDVFMAKHRDKRENIGGYFSYMENNLTKCIFFSREKNAEVIGTVTFDKTFNVKTAIDNGTTRLFTSYEKDLFVITGPKNTGVVLFGNDYLLLFDEKNNLVSKQKIHNSLITTDLSLGTITTTSTSLAAENPAATKQTGGIHSHVLSDYMTSTDICTLLLYERYTTWEEYVVVSDKYVSKWNCKTDQLNVFTKEAWEKIIEAKKK